MMRNQCSSTDMRVRRLLLTATTLATAVAIPTTAQARATDKEYAEHPPGYVDGSVFTKLAASDGQLVEVTLRRPMLKALRKMYSRTNKGMAAFLGRIHSIDAVVATIAEHDLERAEDEVRRMAERLESEGWERLARVRQSGQKIMVLAHIDDDQIDGLVVFVLERAGNASELVFANIAGPVDLDTLPVVGNSLLVPGLGAGIEAIEHERVARERDAGGEAARDSDRQDADQHGNENSDTNEEAER